MSLLDWAQSTWDKWKARNPFTHDEPTANMANGGTCGFKPATSKHNPVRDTQRQKPMDGTQQMDPNANWDPYGGQIPGGYTTNVPPQGTGYQNWDYTHAGTQQVPYQNVNQNGQFAGAQGTTQYPPQQDFYGNGTSQYPPQMDPYGNGGYAVENNWADTQKYDGMPQNGQYAEGGMYPPQSNPIDNISYMPNSFVGQDRKGYRHSEQVLTVFNVPTCYPAIEAMRNGESVVVNTEQINDEAENTRCLDMLYGAAMAMNCSMTRIAYKSIYLLSPADVMVLPDKFIRRVSDKDINARWPDYEYGNQREPYVRSANQGQPQEGRTRTRRSGYATQNDYANYGGYNAVGYDR